MKDSKQIAFQATIVVIDNIFTLFTLHLFLYF